GWNFQIQKLSWPAHAGHPGDDDLGIASERRTAVGEVRLAHDLASGLRKNPADDVTPTSAAYRWNMVLLLAAAQAIAYIDRANLAVITPYLIREYGYSAAEAGLLVSVFNYAFTASVLFSGPFTDWARPRVSFPLGVGTWSLGTALCGVTQAFAPL